MVVIPELRGLLVVWIMVDFGFEEGAPLDEAIGEPRLGITVAIRQHLVTVEMDYRPHFGCRGLIAVKGWINRQEMARWKVVHPLDCDGLSPVRFKSWPGV